MRPDELEHQGLLSLDPDGGVIKFAGRRALLVDAVGMGLHRKYLVENFGITAARAVLTQFGFAQGWILAKTMREEFEWEEHEDSRLAGNRMLCLKGLFRTQPGSDDPLDDTGAVLLASYEAEQHLLHLGPSDASVLDDLGPHQRLFQQHDRQRNLCARRSMYVPRRFGLSYGGTYPRRMGQ